MNQNKWSVSSGIKLALLIILLGLGITLTKSSLLTKKSFLPAKKLVFTPPKKISTQPNDKNQSTELVYNVTTPPKLQTSQKLQSIVNEVVAVADEEGLPKKRLSITLIDTKNNKVAGYQQDRLRYPASVVKMFWMVYLYAQIEKHWWLESDYKQYLKKMINDSDNVAASYIIDTTTSTQSGKDLRGKEYQQWLKKRLDVNNFFLKARYKNIYVSQKTFPIPSINMDLPRGSDLKMRGNPDNPIYNKITTKHAARLLYEIYHNQAVSPDYSHKMAELLSIDALTRIEKKKSRNIEEFNPVRGFISESLPKNVYYGGKAGLTSGSRNEAAYIATPDRKYTYILVIFAQGAAYADDWKTFPKMSRLVFNRMTK